MTSYSAKYLCKTDDTGVGKYRFTLGITKVPDVDGRLHIQSGTNEADSEKCVIPVNTQNTLICDIDVSVAGLYTVGYRFPQIDRGVPPEADVYLSPDGNEIENPVSPQEIDYNESTKNTCKLQFKNSLEYHDLQIYAEKETQSKRITGICKPGTTTEDNMIVICKSTSKQTLSKGIYNLKYDN